MDNKKWTLYNKLVRDKIPDIILETGAKCAYRKLSDEEFLEALNAKLNEEVAEYQESGSVEELADILEVVYTLAYLKGYNFPAMDDLKKRKAEERGGFHKKIMLCFVEEKDETISE